MALGVLGMIMVVLGGCGQTSGRGGASPTPTPISVLAQQYSKAADTVNAVLDPINARLAGDCKTLNPCKADLSQWAVAENDFRAALRSMKFPSSMQADQRALLDIEQRQINLVENGANATSFDQISADFNSLDALRNEFEDDVVHVRFDLGLPTAPTETATPVATA